MNEREFDELWVKPVIRVGITTLLLAAFFSFLPVLYLYFAYGTFPSFAIAMKSWGMIATLFGAMYIVEPVSYYSVLGLSGTYMSFLSGNISNLRLPCAALALEATETEPATKEAEVISTLGIAGSIITNLIGTTLAAFVGAALITLFPPVIANAFTNFTASAIFGAVFGQFAIKYPKLAVVALGIPVLLRFTTTLPAWVLIIASVFGTVAIAKLLFDHEEKSAHAKS